jgi:hypothetical protein
MNIIYLAVFILIPLILIGYLSACAGAGKFINFVDWLLLRDRK